MNLKDLTRSDRGIGIPDIFAIDLEPAKDGLINHNKQVREVLEPLVVEHLNSQHILENLNYCKEFDDVMKMRPSFLSPEIIDKLIEETDKTELNIVTRTILAFTVHKDLLEGAMNWYNQQVQMKLQLGLCPLLAHMILDTLFALLLFLTW